MDDTSWNRLIDRSPQSVAYAYTWYLDCVAPGWQALVWPSAADMRVVMPLPVRRKLGMRTVRQPLFCQYLGPFGAEAVSEETMRRFLDALTRSFPYLSAYSFHPAHTPVLHRVLPQFPELTVREMTTHWLDLREPYDEVRKNYRADRVKNLKRAGKYPWRPMASEEVEPLVRLFRENHAPHIPGVKESAYTLLRRLYGVLSANGAGTLRYAELDGRIRAGLMVLEKNGTAVYLFNAADAVGRRGNARTFLLDSYFRERGGRADTFDFESPEVPSIASFYKSFGAEEKRFITIRKNRLPFPLRQFQEWRKGVLSGRGPGA